MCSCILTLAVAALAHADDRSPVPTHVIRELPPLPGVSEKLDTKTESKDTKSEGAAPKPETSAAVVPTPPVDLHPRPLGRPRQSPTASSEGSAPTGTKPTDAAPKQSAWAAFIANSVVRTTGSLTIVLALMFGLSFLTKKVASKSSSLAAAFGAGGPSPAGLISVLGRYPIGRGQTLVLLKLDRRVLLLSQTTPRMRNPIAAGPAGSLTLLCEISDAEDVASILLRVQEADGDSTADRFRTLLERYDRQHADADPVIELPSTNRQVATNDDGDQVELWDDSVPEEVADLEAPEPIKIAEHVPLSMSLRDRLVGVSPHQSKPASNNWGRA